MDERTILLECLNDAASGSGHAPSKLAREMVETVASSGNSAAITVMITSLLKQCADPRQDVRLHRTDIPGGYSGRDLDAKTVTPFLESNGFSADWRSGWSDRSFNAKVPYGFGYTGNISSSGVREAFLSLLDYVENGEADPRDVLTHTLKALVDLREIGKVKLDRPAAGLTADDAAKVLEKHFKCGGQARIRLPTLAVHAAYSEAAAKGMWSCASISEPAVRGTGTGASGHVKAFDPDTGFVFESIQVLHGKSITPAMVQRAGGDARDMPTNKYRFLAATPAGDMEAATRAAGRAGTNNCQVIVSSVLDGIKWALSLLDDMDGFVERYVGLVEDDDKIKYVHKRAWNDAVRMNLQP